ncbi:MAG: GDP-mannose 4,6-dehydratase [Verrucomicrobium sp.]|nr:GDP-mannose 4,6-dehydratase [Verrucomicrobium sp.]
MKCIVTGGCGFVGSNLVARLLERGASVTVCDHLGRSGGASNLEWLRGLGDIDFVKLDLRQAEGVDAVLQRTKPEAVFHLAGQVAMTTSINDPRLDFETNAMGSFNLLEAVRRHAPDAKVVYASTNKVYGELHTVPLAEEALRYAAPGHPRGVDESAPLDFQTPYGCSKGTADQYMLDYSRVYGLNTAVFRHSTIYGGRQYATFDQGWVGWFCQQAIATQNDPERAPFTIAGNGKQVRDLLYVDDAVDAYLAAAEHMDKAKGQAFNIGGGIENSSSLLELFLMLEEMLKIKLRYEMLPWRHSDQRFFVADSSKAERLLGWKPRVDKAKGVARMAEWAAVLDAEQRGKAAVA